MYPESRLTIIDKIVSLLSIWTFGTAGFLYLIYIAIAKKPISSFTRYYIFMTIFVSLLWFVLSGVLNFLLLILGQIPYLNIFIGSVVFFLTRDIFAFGGIHFSIITMIVTLFLVYLSMGIIMERIAYIPYLTNIVGRNSR